MSGSTQESAPSDASSVTVVAVSQGLKISKSTTGNSFRRSRYLIMMSNILLDCCRSHTGEKPFLCKFFKECSKAFSNSSDRAKHEQTHRDPVSEPLIGQYSKYSPLIGQLSSR